MFRGQWEHLHYNFGQVPLPPLVINFYSIHVPYQMTWSQPEPDITQHLFCLQNSMESWWMSTFVENLSLTFDWNSLVIYNSHAYLWTLTIRDHSKNITDGGGVNFLIFAYEIWVSPSEDRQNLSTPPPPHLRIDQIWVSLYIYIF